MIGIEINGEFLDLPTTFFEVVRNSPYITNEELLGEYSLPVSIPYTDKNYRLLNYYGNHYKAHKKESIEGALHGGPNFMHNGKLVIDGFDKNMNVPGSQLTTGIFTFGISSFWQDVKGKKLTDLTLGGTRNFTWTTNNPYDGSPGFWQHVHAVASAPIEYTFVPIYNDGYGDYPGDLSSASFKHIDWMNKLDMNAHSVLYFADIQNAVSLCPAINIKYLLLQAMQQYGWKIEGEVLDDPTFSKLYSQSFRGIYWCNYSTATGFVNIFVKSSIDINLAEHVPDDYTIADFIIDLKNRYGICFKFDTNTKKCTALWLKNVVENSGVDFTAYVGAQVNVKTDAAVRNISLRNVQDSSDSYIAVTENASFPQEAPVRALRNRPAPAGIDEGNFIYVFEENTWYQRVTTGGTAVWRRVLDNIGDYVAADETESITTKINTFAISEQVVRGWSGHNYYGYMMACNQPGNWKQNEIITPFTMRSFICHGPQLDRRDDNTTVESAYYPYGSCHTSDNNGNDLGGWSNIYKYNFGGINNGIYEAQLKNWVQIFANTDVRTYTFLLPLYMLQQLKFEQVIIIKSVRFLIKTIKYTLPYNGTAIVTLHKMDA
jgi:hypothetical protein